MFWAKLILIFLFVHSVLFNIGVIRRIIETNKDNSNTAVVCIVGIFLHILAVGLCYHLLGVFDLSGE